ncbi:MAG TPA: hypothetical protein VLR90_00600 [Blastocatellia bacterium]|nr:hypothetical protein [Blastocatellia bacterium]
MIEVDRALLQEPCRIWRKASEYRARGNNPEPLLTPPLVDNLNDKGRMPNAERQIHNLLIPVASVPGLATGFVVRNRVEVAFRLQEDTNA